MDYILRGTILPGVLTPRAKWLALHRAHALRVVELAAWSVRVVNDQDGKVAVEPGERTPTALVLCADCGLFAVDYAPDTPLESKSLRLRPVEQAVGAPVDRGEPVFRPSRAEREAMAAAAAADPAPPAPEPEPEGPPAPEPVAEPDPAVAADAPPPAPEDAAPEAAEERTSGGRRRRGE